MAVSALLIDLDGTLWDSAPWYASLLEPDDRRRRQRLAEQLRDSSAGLRAAPLLRERYSAAGFTTACMQRGARLRLYPGAEEVLRRLRRRIALGVVTSLPGWMTHPMLAAHGLDDLFTVVQTAKWGVPSKPHPAGIRHAVAALAVPPADVVYLGDARTDLAAAMAAPVPFRWAAWGYDEILTPVDRASSWMDVGELA
ncbi:HAD superfamily hydrolase (TIGR01509 family) [Geodermatophilus bullaregiensis]|uniref:HAD family hydrolase n=1 Tax=Geodermatophilus bullaregiensis TaxID=1564160 RepID=UPI00195B22AE|nr:HAD-IA family hydrolase [Geodermatophilus bullaregiensis]MBM7804203.1 HAD superfamily hydrolase (TIGR01509 family) [Geodermatophilus bullaregiensis]